MDKILTYAELYNKQIKNAENPKSEIITIRQKIVRELKDGFKNLRDDLDVDVPQNFYDLHDKLKAIDMIDQYYHSKV